MPGNDGTASLEELLAAGWDYHDTESARLTRALEAAADTGVPPAHLVQFLHLSTHTIGEHLGDWERALRLGRRVLDGHTPTSETAKAWGWLYVSAVMAGDAVAASDFELSYLKAAGGDFGAALLDMRFMLAGALLGAKRAGEAARLYRGAMDLVGQIGQSARLDRTIAVAGNNLAWELYEMPARTAGDDDLMRLAAEASLTYWRKCGNWINAERAHYLNALVANASGDPASGLGHADTALAIIAANGQRPLDTARLHLARAASLGALGDAGGRAAAVKDADVAAAKLTAPDLQARFAAERARVADAVPATRP